MLKAARGAMKAGGVAKGGGNISDVFGSGAVRRSYLSDTTGGTEASDGRNYKRNSNNCSQNSSVDAHELWRSITGKEVKNSQDDVFQTSDYGEMLILRKGGKGEPVRTKEIIK